MKSASVIILCFLSFFVGCMFSACFMSLDSNVNKNTKISQSSKVMKVYSVLKDSDLTVRSLNDVIVVVISAPSHFERRRLIRETWAKDIKHHHFTVVFSIGTSGLSEKLNKTLRIEHSVYSDLVFLEHVQEHYNLLTAKVLQTFVWLNFNSDQRLILKCDDDSFINVKELVKSPVLRSNDQLLYWGYFTGRAPVHRTGKWKELQWNICDQYVPYARGGGYILSREVIRYLATNAHMFSVYQSEDVSVGLWLAPLNLTQNHDINFDTEYKSRGCKNSYIITHPHTEASIRSLHKALQDTGKLCIKETVCSFNNNGVFPVEVPKKEMPYPVASNFAVMSFQCPIIQNLSAMDDSVCIFARSGNPVMTFVDTEF